MRTREVTARGENLDTFSMAEKPYQPNPGEEATSSDAAEMIATCINREVE